MNRVAAGMALALAISAYAEHPQTFNRYGFVGVNKTQSAQSLGSSNLVFSFLGEGTFGSDMFPNNQSHHAALGEYRYDANGVESTKAAPVKNFMGLGANVGLSIGLLDFFDLGVNIPIYYDKLNAHDVDGKGAITETDVAYFGNLNVSLKGRLPLPEDQPMDVALFFGSSFGTASQEDQGLWIRQLEYINKNTAAAYAFGADNTVLTFGLAVTADLDKSNIFPFLIHLNGGYRMSLNDDYLSVPFASAAADIYFTDFFSVFAEYYVDFQIDEFKWNKDVNGRTVEEKLDLQQLTAAAVFHLPIGLKFQLGGSYYLGGNKFIHNVYVLENDSRSGNVDTKSNRVVVERTRVNPEYSIYGGLTWNGFLIPQDRDGDGVVDKDDKCPNDFGHRLNQGCPLANPDPDEDGVCDAWVTERNLSGEFVKVCDGVDACPNEYGEGEDGCPLPDPDPDKDGVCDTWVTQKMMLNKFSGICVGIDGCPTQAGTIANSGCPEDNPDPDADGVCSPWVTDKGKLAEFADICKGYDMCPGEAGPTANKGCPWDDPDSDGDGLCDEWVTQKKMGYFFENADGSDPYITKTCKGLDKCPLEYGPANNDGCPLGNPDSDKDSICDPWVSEKGLLEQYEGICTGLDKCPNDPGTLLGQGCPIDNPDADGDSLCSPWVTEKGMLKDFASVCHGVDKCPAEAGPEWNKGCPAENPDPDGDSLCSPWVTKQNMLEQFASVCRGYDRCEDEAGPEWNKGCPMEDDPDSDHDGVCSQWVFDKKLSETFKNVCSGVDRCPDVAGDDGHGCPKKPVEKLDGVTFKSGKATLESNAKSILKNVAKKLNTDESYKELHIVIQGHTDNKGKEKTNLKLSENRAKEVMKMLTKFGVDKNRIKAVGLGSSCPIDDNKTADGREMNRRIEMHFATPDNDGTKCESNYAE